MNAIAKAVTGNGDGANGRMFMLLQWLIGILVSVNIALTVAFMRTTLENDNRITAIEASRFSAKDGLEVWQAISLLRNDIITANARIPAEFPPRWFVERVDKLEKRVDVVEQQPRGGISIGR